jgi:hypothetical protein
MGDILWLKDQTEGMCQDFVLSICDIKVLITYSEPFNKQQSSMILKSLY